MCRIERCTQWLHSVHSCCAWCSDVFKILHISIVFAHLCKIWRVYAALSWVSMIRSGFDTHLNVQNRKMYAMVTLCTFLLRFCSDVFKILHISIVFAHLCKIWRVYAALSWVRMIRSGFDMHLNVQNRKMYAIVTLCTFCCAWCSDVVKILHISIVFAHLCKIWRVYAALSWVSMIRSGFDTHLNVQNRKMYAIVTLCTFLLRLVLWCSQIIEHF